MNNMGNMGNMDNMNNMGNMDNMNGIILPKRIMTNLNEATGYFGESFKDMVLVSIEENIKKFDIKTIKALQDSIDRNSNNKEALEEHESIILKHFENGKIIYENQDEFAPKSFLDKLKLANPNYMNRFPITEGEGEGETDGGVSDRGTIEGDNEDPGEQVPQEEQVPPEMDDEQKLQLELAQTDSKFITVVLYDKIVELLGSIKTIKENITASKTETELDMFITLEKYEAYLEILNELIFVMDLNTIYYNVVNITIEVNDLLNKYLISTKVKIINNKDMSKEEKEKAILDLQINNTNTDETNDEIDNMEKNSY